MGFNPKHAHMGVEPTMKVSSQHSSELIVDVEISSHVYDGSVTNTDWWGAATNPQTSSASEGLKDELDELKRYLSTIHTHLHNNRGSSRHNGYHQSIGALSHILISIHGDLQDTLYLIEKEDRKTYQPGTKVYTWKLETLSWMVESITIQNIKLRVLLCTFDPDETVEAAIPPHYRKWRSQIIEDYVESEIKRCGRKRGELLFGIFTKLETEYLTPDVVRKRTKTQPLHPSTSQIPQTPSLVQDRHESISTKPTQSMGNDEYGVVFECRLGGEQADYLLKVRIDAEGALTIKFDEEPRLWPASLQAFRELDLRRASIHLSYLTPDVYMCALILERNRLGRIDVTTGCLFFQSSTDMKGFQRALTGKRGIKLRTLEKFKCDSKNAITGRLQIWLKDSGRSYDSTQTGLNSVLRRTSTSFSATSRTTLASMATLKAQQAIPGSQLTRIDEGCGLSIEMPIPPLVIMFVEWSSKDKKIQRGQILAFKFDEHSKLDRKKCKLDDKFPRCFVLHAVRVDLEIGPWKFPLKPKELSWIELSFSNDEEREVFTKQLEDARTIYKKRMEQHNRGMKFLRQGHHNTKEYGAY
ncbi:hypothetical protein SBOR_8633 [Sclerotinia borealis F-4128]|uniref:Uncharacterized protein n=1 Tax=Sclerotinia borealis (strain F-4128) TaxID=1432307 RepID=W9C8T7_SCLBF|nr:hypothetical protein SBOR_8633 [Sclerotinia borealis F-4128]